jgi:hypothetical protein
MGIAPLCLILSILLRNTTSKLVGRPLAERSRSWLASCELFLGLPSLRASVARAVVVEEMSAMAQSYRQRRGHLATTSTLPLLSGGEAGAHHQAGATLVTIPRPVRRLSRLIAPAPKATI